MITPERLRELLDYDPDTGFFTWRRTQKHGRRIEGVRAGNVKQGVNRLHRYIQLDRKSYTAARLAWLHVHGEWPQRIFFVNGDSLDDRLDNLRDRAPVYRGARIAGVYQVCNRFQVSFRHQGQAHYVGTFETFEQAKAALLKARTALKAPSKFGNAKWIYKVKRGWSVRWKKTRKGKLIHLGTYPTLEAARRRLARARRPPVPRKRWYEQPGAMSAE
jgi:HNH endonuclease